MIDLIRNITPMRLRYLLLQLRGRGYYEGFPDRHQAIFIHIPKTAGSSVAHALDHKGYHATAQQYRHFNRRKFAAYYKFSFVRNPWDRLVSTFHYLKADKLPINRPFVQKHLSAYDDFDSFIRGWLTPEAIWIDVHFYPQHHFLQDEDGNMLADFVGRVESLEQDFATVTAHLGIDADLPWDNRSERGPYADYYTPETAALVADIYQKDIDLFGYRFDPATPTD